MHEEHEQPASYLKRRFEGLAGVEVIEDQFDVCACDVCDRFGGCQNCRGILIAREIDPHGQPAGPTRLFLCTHWCHRATPE